MSLFCAAPRARASRASRSRLCEGRTRTLALVMACSNQELFWAVAVSAMTTLEFVADMTNIFDTNQTHQLRA
jgi:hypothetical protein